MEGDFHPFFLFWLGIEKGEIYRIEVWNLMQNGRSFFGAKQFGFNAKPQRRKVARKGDSKENIADAHQRDSQNVANSGLEKCVGRGFCAKSQ